jgi:Fusaric acid resistance protein-like
MKPDYKNFFIESLKIFFFCVFIETLFAFKGASQKELLILLNLAVMSSSATFSIKNEKLSLYFKAAFSIFFFTIAGGVLGFYYKFLAKILFIALAFIAYFVPRTNFNYRILLNSCFVFLIFSNLTFDLKSAYQYSLDGILFIASFCIFHRLVDQPSKRKDPLIKPDEMKVHKLNALIAFISLSIGWALSEYLQITYNFKYLYWIPLSILLILQGDISSILKTSLRRILLSSVAAVTTVSLFNFILPNNFLINICFLFLVLFFMFFFRFSQTRRILFIEIYVLALAYLLSQHPGLVVFERVLFTFTGAVIAIGTTLLVYKLNEKRVIKIT